MVCSRCEKLPEKMRESGELYLWPPLGHTLTKLRRRLRSEGWESRVNDDYSVVVSTKDDNVKSLLPLISESLSTREIEDTRSLFKTGGDGLTVTDIPLCRSLSRLYSIENSEWLLDMLAEGRLTSHFQPIVHAENPGEVFGQESLLRGVDPEGGLVSPGEIFAAAKEADLLFQTDLAARRTAIREAARHDIQANVFVNFTPTSIYDPEFCLRSTVETADEVGLSRERIVFEVTESEDTADVNHLREIADYYRSKGFRIALDDMGSGYSSLNLLNRLKPDFMKLDMQLIQGVNYDLYKAVVASKLLEMAQELSLMTIVEGIETEQELVWARRHGATFVQGFFIARPSSPPARLSGSHSHEVQAIKTSSR